MRLALRAGMDGLAYAGFKTFLSYEGTANVGNCAACHTPANFTDGKSHVVRRGGTAKPTPSLRNLVKREVDLRKALLQKLEAWRQKQSGQANDISDAYAAMKLSERDIPGLVAFLKLLEDVPDDRSVPWPRNVGDGRVGGTAVLRADLLLVRSRGNGYRVPCLQRVVGLADRLPRYVR